MPTEPALIPNQVTSSGGALNAKAPLELSASKCLSEKELLATYLRPQTPFVRASSLKLLVNGEEAFPAMLNAIASARHTVELETYILSSDKVGLEFQVALIAAAARKVRVRLLYDGGGSIGISSAYIAELVSAGVEVAVFHPLRFDRPLWAWNRRDHRKILIVDDQISFTGGLNITAPKKGQTWRDIHVEIHGKVVAAQMAILFEHGWTRARHFGSDGTFKKRRLLHHFRRNKNKKNENSGSFSGIAVKVIGNERRHNRRQIRKSYLYAIHHARDYILLENAYFIPDRGIRRALFRAVRRGVKVVVATARYSDVPAAGYASRALYRELIEGGVRIFEWPHGMLHGKVAVIDEAWAIAGSYNIDNRSLLHNLEAVVVVLNREFALRLRDQILSDIKTSEEVILAAWKNRPWLRRLLEEICFSLRWWL